MKSIITDISSRIDSYFNAKSISSYKVSKTTGLSEPTINRYRKGESKPNSKSLLILFEKYPDLENYLNGNETIDKEPAKKSYEVGRPFYDGDWELGFKDSFDENLTNPEFNIDFPPANKTDGFWMRGRGKSMLGEIDPGDYIYFSELKDFSWFPFGRIYGIVTKNKMRTVKRIVQSEKQGHYKLISSNPDKINYPDQDIPVEMIVKIFEVKFVIKNLDL